MITFTITANSSISPEQICEGIFDVDQWVSFVGYGPLPGIRKVTKESPLTTPVGTIFYVENTDGSKHKETVQSFNPGKQIIMRMDDFSQPLCSLVTHFVERWDFADTHPDCRITRIFELYPKNIFASVPVWLISRLLKKAVENHTKQLANPK
jgi:hypothetical protein